MTLHTSFRIKRFVSALTLATLTLAAGVARGEEPRESFTHIAQIPSDSDTGSIRFQKAKMIQIPTTITYTTNPQYCQDLAFRDPGGSSYCSFGRLGTFVAAYELTFSVVGPPLISDEYGNRNFTFEVYFRPEELAPDVRQAISDGKRGRSDIAGSFKMSTSRKPVSQVAIDEANSRFCAGNLLDGSWTISDPKCKDQVRYRHFAAPSDYLTVRIDPSSVRAGLASANKTAAAIPANQ
jgi:hypothetical protein